ncbi:MAG: hypothetical protein DMG65_26585 [Candidatus Angelobacter sp. Gp1-AA117]|nr:MAG: hypothetical protein DMG65_26585 [Candidatus Angelobacter sp. Gp1-AA117]
MFVVCIRSRAIWKYIGNEADATQFRLFVTLFSFGGRVPWGRVVSVSYCILNDCSYNVKASASYDLVGNMISLTYPSGRKVAFNYNSGSQLDQVQFTQWAGPRLHPTPTGAPQTATSIPRVLPNCGRWAMV